ncbi:unnamed protein product [Cylicocyclus nassatus]|uniref:Uncharacterized protein n=1 Tax=Cylicocyclus nassatus TaxID=53992 RepID=A0AA36DPD4_CYLNA|nr:unnamed protein product [Cylicocyclus nassatus]
MNVFITVGGRFCIVCLPESIITQVAERMGKKEILLLQTFLPTTIVIPLYLLYDHQYEMGSIPMFLTATRPDFDQVISVIKMTFRTSAFAISFFAYIYMFWMIQKKAKRKETNILIHGGCLMSALGGSSIFDFHMGAIDKSHGLFLFTAILWIPCTNIITTFCVIILLRRRLRPSSEAKLPKIFITIA